jgi:lysophosphatidate acyltransferase
MAGAAKQYLPILILLLLFFMLSISYYPKTATYFLSTIIPLYILSRFSTTTRYYYRLTCFLLGLGTASIWGVIVSIALSLVGKSHDINYVVARSFHGCVAPLVGMSFTVEGEEYLQNTKPAVIIGNHQTMIDILCKSSPLFPPTACL